MSRDGYTSDEWDDLLAILPRVLVAQDSLTDVMRRLAQHTKLYGRGAVRQVVRNYRRHLGYEWTHAGKNPRLRKVQR